MCWTDACGAHCSVVFLLLCCASPGNSGLLPRAPLALRLSRGARRTDTTLTDPEPAAAPLDRLATLGASPSLCPICWCAVRVMPLPLSATDAELWSALLEQHSRIANVSADIAAADIQTSTELLIAATDSAWVLRTHTHT